MLKTLIYYMPEYVNLARKLRGEYIAHHHEDVDIISEEEQDDIEYARKMLYDEAIFIEDSGSVSIHDIKSGYTRRCSIADVLF